jgi:biotin carboxyl carrier protein
MTQVGDIVEAGQKLMVLEAMKVHTLLIAHLCSPVIARVGMSPGSK